MTIKINAPIKGTAGIAVRRMGKKDAKATIGLLSQTPEFGKGDVSIFLECLDEYLAGSKDYEFLCAEEAGKIIGSICYGYAPIAKKVFDIYWIVVHPKSRMKGIGNLLLSKAESACAKKGARMLVIETESDMDYEKARRFYEKCGFVPESAIRDFYSTGNDKIIYIKRF